MIILCSEVPKINVCQNQDPLESFTLPIPGLGRAPHTGGAGTVSGSLSLAKEKRQKCGGALNQWRIPSSARAPGLPTVLSPWAEWEPRKSRWAQHSVHPAEPPSPPGGTLLSAWVKVQSCKEPSMLSKATQCSASKFTYMLKHFVKFFA